MKSPGLAPGAGAETDTREFLASVFPPWYRAPSPSPRLVTRISLQDELEADPFTFCDPRKGAHLRQVKDAYSVKGFEAARSAANPFEKIGSCGFINRAAVKLANIDAVIPLTLGEKFTFCDVAAGPGGFTQYLQFRRPDSRGFGMSLELPRGSSFNWATDFLRLGPEAFTITKGQDGTGDLYTNWRYFTDFVLERVQGGVDLVTADGGIENEDYARREGLNTPLLIAQSLVGLGCAREGGSFLLKTFGAGSRVSGQVLYLVSLAFERVTLFKPVSSRPANEEIYFVCQGRRGEEEVRGPLAVLREAFQATQGGRKHLSNILGEGAEESEEGVPPAFAAWLREQNDRAAERQLWAGKAILERLAGVEAPPEEYFIPKFALLWGLPDRVHGRV